MTGLILIIAYSLFLGFLGYFPNPMILVFHCLAQLDSFLTNEDGVLIISGNEILNLDLPQHVNFVYLFLILTYLQSIF